MHEIDETQAFITLEDGSRWHVLNEQGEMDASQTEAAIMAYLSMK